MPTELGMMAEQEMAWFFGTNGAIIYSSYRELFNFIYGLEAEISACMEGLSLAMKCMDLSILVEMYSLSAMNILCDNF